MSRLLFLLIMFMVTGCDLDGPFNKIPCSHDFTNLLESLNQFHLRGHGYSPKGFHSKSKYDTSDVDCSDWEIYLSVDSCNDIFFNEKYVMNMAKLSFAQTKNKDIVNIGFEIDQCIFYLHGQKRFFYKFHRNEMDTCEIKMLPVYKTAKIIKILSEGYYDDPNNKTVELLLNSLPEDPYSIAYSFWLKNKQFKHIELEVTNTESKFCKKVEYSYSF